MTEICLLSHVNSANASLLFLVFLIYLAVSFRILLVAGAI